MMECPKCGDKYPPVEKMGRYGAYWYCETCKSNISKNEKYKYEYIYENNNRHWGRTR